jgi:hypothetical protein
MTRPRFTKHGFGFLARKTIVTDVVRENNQTYRLGWTEQCKDGSRMGAGMPEYLLLFRKPPTDTSNGYADLPVVKSKQDYSRSRWQIDAHGFMRSSGNRLLSAEDLQNIPHERIFKFFREHSLKRCTTMSTTSLSVSRWNRADSASTSTPATSAVGPLAATARYRAASFRLRSCSCSRNPGIRTFGPTLPACAP